MLADRTKKLLLEGQGRDCVERALRSTVAPPEALAAVLFATAGSDVHLSTEEMAWVAIGLVAGEERARRVLKAMYTRKVRPRLRPLAQARARALFLELLMAARALKDELGGTLPQ